MTQLRLRLQGLKIAVKRDCKYPVENKVRFVLVHCLDSCLLICICIGTIKGYPHNQGSFLQITITKQNSYLSCMIITVKFSAGNKIHLTIEDNPLNTKYTNT